MLRTRSRYKQHVQREEATKRHRLWGPRGLHGGPQVRDSPHNIPILLPVPLPLHPLHQPGQHPNQQPTRRHVVSHHRLHRRAFGEGLPPQHHWKPPLLRRPTAPALDIRPGPRLPMLPHHGPGALQLGLCVQWEWSW